MQPISILICDDQTLLRETWALLLRKDPRFSNIIECGSGEEAIDQARINRPDIVLMDINLPGMDGCEATKQIRKYSPSTKVLALSLHNEPAYARRMFKAGAMGYVTKNSHHEEMIAAIFEITGNNKYICNEIKMRLVQQELTNERPVDGLRNLSRRELEVVKYVAAGDSSKEIAEKLKVSVKTIEVHRYNIMRKLKLKNAAALTNYVHKHNPF